MEKQFELYDRHDGRRSQFASTGFTLEEAAEQVHEDRNGKVSIEDATESIEALEVGKEWCYDNGNYTQRFVKRTK